VPQLAPMAKPPSPGGDGGGLPDSAIAKDLPVKHTFIDVSPDGPASIVGWHKEREVQSSVAAFGCEPSAEGGNKDSADSQINVPVAFAAPSTAAMWSEHEAGLVAKTIPATSSQLWLPSVCEEDKQPLKVKAASKILAGLSEFEYPLPFDFKVKNTFIDHDEPRSVDGFLLRRDIKSCINAIGRAPTSEEDDEDMPMDASTDQVSEPKNPGADNPLTCIPSTMHTTDVQQLPLMPPPQSPDMQLGRLPVSGSLAPPWGNAHIFAFPALPSKGSQDHYAGTCRPCAYLHTKGCANGVDCDYCHMCPAGELKRRQKEKRLWMRRKQMPGW